MMILNLISFIVWYLVVSCIVGIVLLVLANVTVTYANLNPFSRAALLVRQFSDPLINPVRRILMRYGLDQKLAPFITILIAILVAWLLNELVGSVLFTAKGIITSVASGAMIALMGYLLFGVLAVYSLLIIMRIVFSWGLSFANPMMRFLLRVTEPILAPFRRLIPPLGMLDISPIIVLLVIQLFQRAIAGTLMR